MAKLNSINPATGEILGSVKISTKAEVELAVKTARDGFLSWKTVALEKRAKILLNLSQLIKRDSVKLATMITQEMGKPLVEAKEEVLSASEGVKYWATKGYKYIINEPIGKTGNKTSVIVYEPVGVIAAIKPWNFPVDTALMSIAPALLAGNSVVFKPSEYVGLVSEALVKLIWQAGVPKNVLLLLQGRSQVGEMLVDAEVNLVSFTGSSQVGREIATKCGPRMIKYVLELGGSSPAIVCKDADLDLTTKAIISGRFFNCGQVCCAIKRVLIEGVSTTIKLTKKLEDEIRALKVGDPLDKNTDIGPLVSEKQLKAFEHQVTRGVIQGGRITVGGRRLRDGIYAKGWFHEPTLISHVSPRNEVMQEEVFGPMLPICTVMSVKEAIKVANDNKYGLTAAVFTSSKVKAKEILAQLEAGSVYLNETYASVAEAPWCGLKQSGAGAEGGKFGIWELVHKKHVRL
ncbi:MAG: aldehyde dehydrogenase family protein [Candidatus Beckwithbacteria bacterium]